MNFCWITLNVCNLEESLKFYHEIIGLNIATKFSVGEDTEIVMLGEKNGTKVELIYNKNQIDLVQTKGLSIGFEVDSLDEAIKLFKDNNISIKKGQLFTNTCHKVFLCR